MMIYLNIHRFVKNGKPLKAFAFYVGIDCRAVLI